MKILVTGAAGFIGFHLSRRLAERGDEVVGLDSINDYYPTSLKYDRLAELGISHRAEEWGEKVTSSKYPALSFVRMRLEDRASLERLFHTECFDVVVNLAAQAGVRYSITNPREYIDSNIIGFLNIIECTAHYCPNHLIYASSSSVYGDNRSVPFREEDRVDNPASMYAVTKRTNEMMALVFSKLYMLPTTGLRFFTVYGSWGRPDMAPMIFARAISDGQPIEVFNGGDMERDFTHISDIIEGVTRIIDHKPDKLGDRPLAQVYNIGCSSPVNLMDFIAEMERAVGRRAIKEMRPMQAGDVKTTYADTTKLQSDFGYPPHVSLREGIGEFIAWYNQYFGK